MPDNPSWVDPETSRASCPECEGFGYYTVDETEADWECSTCMGSGVATVEQARAYLNKRIVVIPDEEG